MKEIPFTQTQAKDITKTLIKGIKTLETETLESAENKQVVVQLFNEENVKLIQTQKLFYYGMLDKLKGKPINQTIKSRIYHMMANLRKDKKI